MISFDDAYSWLFKCSTEGSQLSTSAQRMLNLLWDAIDRKDYQNAWSIFARLRDLNRQTTNELEAAEIHLECGRAAYQMGNHASAEEQIREAVSHYRTRRHQHAVAQWMLGHVLLVQPARRQAGIETWQSSLTEFMELSTHCRDTEWAPWYRARWREMNDALQCAITKDCLPPDSTSYGEASAPPRAEKRTKNPPPNPGGPRPAPVPPGAVLRLFTVTDEIRAGEPGAMGFDYFPITYVDIETLEIDGNPYRLVSLNGGRIVSFTTAQTYTILQVKGDSMNLAGIDEGDYVLLRMQADANPYQIVAAETPDNDTVATLKRYLRRGKKIILQPESTNITHRSFEFSPEDNGFHIRGVAEAVLKRSTAEAAPG